MTITAVHGDLLAAPSTADTPQLRAVAGLAPWWRREDLVRIDVVHKERCLRELSTLARGNLTLMPLAKIDGSLESTESRMEAMADRTLATKSTLAGSFRPVQ